MRAARLTSQNAVRPAGTGGGVTVRVVALLAVATFITYVDRGSLATAAPLVRDEFALSNTQLGLLLSALFWSYAPGQLRAGWLAERLDARRVLACGLAIWVWNVAESAWPVGRVAWPASCYSLDVFIPALAGHLLDRYSAGGVGYRYFFLIMALLPPAGSGSR